jgi:RNA-directed DNA polymerase
VTVAKKQWIFEGDFKGCFDNLNHEFIMEQLNNFPAKELIGKWLKAGYVDNNTFHTTELGTPQGGIISPLLANITLHGIEDAIGIEYYTKRNKKREIARGT